MLGNGRVRYRFVTAITAEGEKNLVGITNGVRVNPIDRLGFGWFCASAATCDTKVGYSRLSVRFAVSRWKERSATFGGVVFARRS